MIEMDDNQLGRNIQHLRIIHNETLRENVYPLSADGSILQNAETQEKLKDEESTAKSSDSGD